MIAGVGLHKKLIAVLLTAFLAFGITGCDTKEDSNSAVDSFEPVNVPEGGWTVESLAKTIRINGTVIPEQFTVENLGEKYDVELTSNGRGGSLRFEGKDIAVVAFSEEDEENDYRKRRITHLLLNDPSIADIISVNGIKIGLSSDEVKKNLGDYFVPQTSSGDSDKGFNGYYYSHNEFDENSWDPVWGNNDWILEVSFDGSDKVNLINFNLE